VTLRARVLAVMMRGPVIPVITIARIEQAVPLARALLEGGVGVIEMTLRSAAALGAIEAIATQVPEMQIGAGTVLNPHDLHAAQAAGARFAVSPGFSPALAAAAQKADLPYLPGVATATEIMQALDAGFDLLKFFPASQSGGVEMLRALQGPFPGVAFCPTGGIGPADAPRYLALSNVKCVGGSWLAPAAALEAADWAGISARAREAHAG
jgi:2-dehydro-3-deoxyphosphogluconate aldolase/(4S)-4-hydroxy-2-oxoglutarate aldolase